MATKTRTKTGQFRSADGSTPKERILENALNDLFLACNEYLPRSLGLHEKRIFLERVMGDTRKLLQKLNQPRKV